MNIAKHDIIILGGGLAGLSSAYILTKAGLKASVYERDSVVGGLSKTVEKNGFRFDLGGHRFFTHDEKVNVLVRNLMGSEMVSVPRSSKIYLRNKYFDYPLRPLNAMFGLGIPTSARILIDYLLVTIEKTIRQKEIISLEDWVVRNFGRTMFSIYFKEYSEKVWGIDCRKISAAWVAQRIQGLSLAKAVKNAVFKFSGRDLPTLTDRFDYPSLGIGRLSDRLREEIERSNSVVTDAHVERVYHSGREIESISVRSHGRTMTLPAEAFISSIPITTFVRMLSPLPPTSVLEAAAKLKFRDLVVVAIMVDRERVTDQTWIYIPERKIPFGRIHEPTNWSPAMAPAGKTLLVMEYFSFQGDAVWNLQDEKLTDLTIDNLVQLRYLKKEEVLDSVVVRVPKAYPLFEVGYREQVEVLHEYLRRFGNLFISGRSGMFRYYNMDVAIRSGVETAEKVITFFQAGNAADLEKVALMGTQIS